MSIELEMMDAATQFLRRGWEPFWLPMAIPGDEGSGKTPCILWKNFWATFKDIKRDFYRPCGIALDCGRSGLVVVDCDTEWGLEHALSVCAPTATVVETGGGGRHLYYRAPAGVALKNRQNILGLGIDIRTYGGYVVAPPTIHWSGRRYRFIRDEGLAVYDPAWFPEPKPYVPPRTVISDPDVERRRQMAQKIIGRIDSIAGQGGDTACFKAACACVQFCNLPFEIALEELRAWNAVSAKPPWPEQRLIYKLREAERLKP